MIIQWDRGVQWYAMGFWDVSLGRTPDKYFRHIIEFGSPRIDEWMEEIHGEVYPLEIYLQVRYHQSREREHDTCKVSLRHYLESLVIPLGLSNAPNTFQLGRRKWHIFPPSDAINIFKWTWRVHMSQLWVADKSIDMLEFFHLGYVVGA